MAANLTAVRRLCADLERFRKQGNPQISVKPSDTSMLEWHFVLHDLPEDTVYKAGQYHGKLYFPERYPFAPPSMIMLTPNGRLETNTKLCLSMTDFHPESWNPAWTVESILLGLLSFMVDGRDPKAVGVLNEPAERRRELAQSSIAFNRSDAEFCELFPELLVAGGPDAALKDGGAAAAQSSPAEAVEDATATYGSGSGHAPGSGSSTRSPSATAAGTPEAQESSALSEADEHNGGDAADAQPEAAAREARGAAESAPGEEDARAEECWICREDGSGERLIQPCACRGSMSGVHASCVEAWIRHHRTQTLGDEVPRCSVCNEPYSGTERRPGVAGYARHVCSGLLLQVARSATLVAFLVAYYTAAQPDLLKLWLRIPLLVFACAFFLHKALVLSVSLPSGRQAPENCLRHFHTSDFRWVAVHIGETVAIVFIMVLWCIFQQLSWWYILPLCLMAAMPLLSTLLRQRSPCSHRNFTIALMILASPIIMLIYVAKVIWANPRRLADPSDGVMHLFVPITAMLLCWFCPSNIPVLALWAAHAAVLAIGLVDKCAIKRVAWKEGRVWWILVQLSVLTTYVANLLHRFSEGILKEDSAMVVLLVSVPWLILCCTLSIMVNWGLCVHQYRTWQSRNGTFTISPSSSPTSAAPQTIGASTQRPGDGPPRAGWRHADAERQGEDFAGA
mmetsp:Transcript_48896/g.98601  ORF Transcript_48896/g.98601 Transcript_48896/m.98601 type:complete len:680 (+) Transcript_48896:81-2120(+)